MGLTRKKMPCGTELTPPPAALFLGTALRFLLFLPIPLPTPFALATPPEQTDTSLVG